MQCRYSSFYIQSLTLNRLLSPQVCFHFGRFHMNCNKMQNHLWQTAENFPCCQLFIYFKFSSLTNHCPLQNESNRNPHHTSHDTHPFSVSNISGITNSSPPEFQGNIRRQISPIFANRILKNFAVHSWNHCKTPPTSTINRYGAPHRI